MLRTAIFSLLICLAASHSRAQFGLSACYKTGKLTQWEVDESGLRGFSGGLHYSIPLLDNRIALSPALMYVHMNSIEPFLGNGSDEITLQAGRLMLPFRFYFINFLKDCDCPTLQKNKGEVNSKLYLAIAPVFALRQLKSGSLKSEWDPRALLSLELGFHLDVFSPIRLTPIAGLEYGFSAGQSPSDGPAMLPEDSESVFLNIGLQCALIQ